MGNLCSVTLVGWQHCYEATRATPLSTAVTITAGTVWRKQTISGQWVQLLLYYFCTFSLFINMADGKGSLSPFSTVGFICSVFLISASLFFERWKQFVTVSLLWFLLSGRRYRFLYMVVKTLPRDARLVTLDL